MLPSSSDPGATKVHEALGVTRKGEIAWPGRLAWTDELVDEPSPHTILERDGVGLTSP